MEHGATEMVWQPHSTVSEERAGHRSEEEDFLAGDAIDVGSFNATKAAN